MRASDYCTAVNAVSALLADAYFHTLDPVAIPLWGSLSVKWYGLAYAAGFVLGWLFIRWMARSGRAPLTVEAAGDLMFYVIVGVLAGGRLGYAIFYQPSLFITFYDHIPFWGLLAINEGGMASHGGIIGVILAVMLFARRNKVSSLHVLDLAALACTGGLFLGRVANFVNAELWGRPLPAAMQTEPPWWSVKYPEEIARWLDDEHQELVVLLTLRLRDVPTVDASDFEQVVRRARQGEPEVIEALRPLLTAYYPSQLFQAVTDGPILAAALILVWLRPRKPGVVGAWFLISYGVLRISTEFFRQPDEGIDVVLGLSRGQWLSVLMIGSGLVGLWVVARRAVEPMGGLRWFRRDRQGALPDGRG